MDRKGFFKLGGLLVLALVVLVGLAGYGRQLQQDMLHHRMMEAQDDRRALLSDALEIDEIRQRLLAEEDSAPAPAPGSDSAEAPDSASYGSSAPDTSSSSGGSSAGSTGSSSEGKGTSASASLGGIAGRRLK